MNCSEGSGHDNCSTTLDERGSDYERTFLSDIENDNQEELSDYNKNL